MRSLQSSEVELGKRICFLLLLLLLLLWHLLLMLRSGTEGTRLRLLSGCPSECIEWVRAHWSLHTWLVSVHSHGHATHLHSWHTSHRLLAHLSHSAHGLHAWHATKGHRLESTCCRLLLDGAEGISLRILLRLTAHHLAERIIAR